MITLDFHAILVKVTPSPTPARSTITLLLESH